LIRRVSRTQIGGTPLDEFLIERVLGWICKFLGLLINVTADWALREVTAKEWSTAYGFDAKPEMIDCVGCTVVEGVHIGHCFECAIRKRGLGRGMANCAVCEMFEGCAIIGDFPAKVPHAKANLEKVRAALKS